MKLVQFAGAIKGVGIGAFMAATLIACAHKPAPEPKVEQVQLPLVDTYWHLSAIKGVALSYDQGQKIPFIQLSATQRLQGFTGCNRITGGYEQSLAWLRFNQLATTRMYCSARAGELEARLLEGLNSSAVFRLAQNRLQLLDYKSRIILEFTPAP